jgi:DNA processing protein
MATTALAYLWMLALPGVGRKTALLIGKRLTTPPAEVGSGFRDALRDAALGVPRFKLPDEATLAAALLSAQRTLEDAGRIGVGVVGFDDPSFPARLRRISDPPAVLYTKGAVEVLNRPVAIGVIGTREPSEFGLRSARRIGSRLPGLGATVVSGLAIGCDAAGHWGCVDAKGVGVAVLAHGLHTVSPAGNRELAEKLLENGGCLVSEYGPGVAAQRTYFVERDRLQSGLSDGLIVVETAEKGGTMHTVGFALEQRRPVGCIDHPVALREHPKAAGNRAMLKDGRATPLADQASLMKFVADATGAPGAPSISDQAAGDVLSLFGPSDA